MPDLELTVKQAGGETMARQVRGKPWWLLVVIVVSAIVLIGVIVVNVFVAPGVKEAAEGVEQYLRIAEMRAATLAEFYQLQPGMTYRQVCQIIGSDGVLVSDVTMAGYHTAMYQWEGYGQLGANMNAMFQNGRLIS